MKRRKVNIIILVVLSLFIKITNIKAKEILLYEEFVDKIAAEKGKTGTDLANYINSEVWKSNNTKVSIREYIMDGETDNVYKYFSHTNLTTLNDYLTIYIENLDIDTSIYDDIRLNIDYLTTSPSTNITVTYGLEVYVIDNDDNEYGPYYIGDFYGTGYYKIVDGETYPRTYNIVSDNLKKTSNIKIKKIKIVPYGNLPLKLNADLTYAGDWRYQIATFIIQGLSIKGYSGEQYSNPNTTIEKINVNDTRLKIAQRMYDFATIKWSPDMTMHSIHNINGASFRNTTYEANEIYYGPPYTQRNRITLETFYNYLDDNYNYKVITKDDGTQSYDTIGNDCGTSVGYSVNKYIPMTNYIAIWNRVETTLLGDLKVDGRKHSSESVREELTDTYLTKLNNNSMDISSEFKNKVAKEVDTRLKSNDLRMWYLDRVGSDGLSNYVIGYTNSTSMENAIVTDESLKLFIDNLDIQSNKNVEIKFKYLIEKSKSKQLLDINNIIFNFCNGNMCDAATDIEMTTPTEISDIYDSSIVTINYTPTTNINRIELLPYGNVKNTGAVFYFSALEININNDEYYSTSATELDIYFDFKRNSSGGLVNSDYVAEYNHEYTQAKIKEITARLLANQRIYGGYKELQIGDVIATQSKDKVHIRLITGNTHVVCLDGTELSVSNKAISKVSGNCDNHGGIDPYNSYFIRTDISAAVVSTSYANRNNYGGLISENDYVAPWTPNPKYTDIKNFSELQDKNLDFYINRKEKFIDAITNSYLPMTFNDYLDGKTAVPYVNLTNGNSFEDIKNGLKGTLYSNYPIISVNYYIKDLTTGEEKTFKEYPNHSANKSTATGYTISEINKEGFNSNFYSLYYNTSESIQNSLKDLINGSEHYKVVVSVDAGTKANMIALLLNTDPEEDEEQSGIDNNQENDGQSEIENPPTGIKNIGIKIIGIILLIITILVNIKHLITKNKKNLFRL